MLKGTMVDADIGLVLLEKLLRVVRAVERLAVSSLPGPAWSRPTMKWVQPWFLRIMACQIASRGPPMRIASGSRASLTVPGGYFGSSNW